MSDRDQAVLHVAQKINHAFNPLKTHIANHTGLRVRLVCKPSDGAVSGCIARHEIESVHVLSAEPSDEIALEAQPRLAKVPTRDGIVDTWVAPQKALWNRLVLHQLHSSTVMMVRPEVGMALISGVVVDTRLLDGVVVLVPLDYSIEATAPDHKPTLVVRSVYTWTPETIDTHKRKRADASGASETSDSSQQ